MKVKPIIKDDNGRRILQNAETQHDVSSGGLPGSETLLEIDAPARTQPRRRTTATPEGAGTAR